MPPDQTPRIFHLVSTSPPACRAARNPLARTSPYFLVLIGAARRLYKTQIPMLHAGYIMHRAANTWACILPVAGVISVPCTVVETVGYLGVISLAILISARSFVCDRESGPQKWNFYRYARTWDGFSKKKKKIMCCDAFRRKKLYRAKRIDNGWLVKPSLT